MSFYIGITSMLSHPMLHINGCKLILWIECVLTSIPKWRPQVINANFCPIFSLLFCCVTAKLMQQKSRRGKNGSRKVYTIHHPNHYELFRIVVSLFICRHSSYLPFKLNRSKFWWGKSIWWAYESVCFNNNFK